MGTEENASPHNFLRQHGSSRKGVLKPHGLSEKGRMKNWLKTIGPYLSWSEISSGSSHREQALEVLINKFWNVELSFGKYNTKEIAFSHENLFFHVLGNS